MSDPLSITAGIVGLLSFGIQVTQTLVDFYSVYKNQDSELAKITHNVEELQCTFRSLEIAVQQRQSRGAEELLQEVDKATQRCQEVIEELQIEAQKLIEAQKSHAHSVTSLKARVQVAGRRAAYPFRKSTLEKLEEDIREIRHNLLFALNVLQLKSHNNIEDGMSEVNSLLERINTSQISLAIRSWLMAPDASLNHNAIWAKRHPSTGLWLINGHQFTGWLVKRNSFLWLNGFAGCGKSVLCSTAIQHTFREMKHRDGVGIAFFYFTFTDYSKQDNHGMLRALLFQLSVQFQDGEKELEQLYTLFKSSTPPVEVLLQTLRRFLDRFQDSYILLDALDECPRDSGRDGVLSVIQAIRDWSLPSVHLLVTSRDLLDIRGSLNPSDDCDLSMRNSGIDKDISDFVSYQLDNDRKLQRWKARRNEIQAKLIQGAQGVFRYVECQLNAFRRARNRNQLDECLRSLPRDLDETYERILCGIDETYAEDVRRILTVLCFSVGPLTVSELIDAHAVELGESPHLDREGRSYEQDDLIDICLGLIDIVVAKDDYGENISIARIAHFSVQEYLQSDRIRQQKAGKFAIQSGPANTELTQICLGYLLEPTLSEGVLDTEGGELDHEKLREFPLAHFAAENWYHYYKRSQEGKSKAEILLSRIFQDENNSFVTWVRLYDIEYPRTPREVYFGCRLDRASRVYGAAVLGLGSVLKDILTISAKATSLSHTVNAQGGLYGSALEGASSKGHKEVVQILLDRGADINTQGKGWRSALQGASSEGHKEVVQLLLDRGADINAQCGFYSSALQGASSEGHKEIVQLLLDRGADINAQCEAYGSALQGASFGGHKEIVQILLDRGADINAQGGAYGSALQNASFGGHKEIVQILLDRGASLDSE